MAAHFLRGVHISERAIQYAVGVAGGCIFGGYLLPHGFFIEKYKRFLQAYKDGLPVPLSPQLRRHVDAVLDDAAVDAEERQQLRFFTAFGADPAHAGETGLRWGAVVGLPQTFAFANAEDVAASGFVVGGQKVAWQSREGALLSHGLCLSPAGQRFAIARELSLARASHVYADGAIGTGAFFVTYSLGRATNRRMGFAQRPLVLRLMLYTLVSLFGIALWTTVTDLVQHYRDSQADQAAAQLGATYAWGGVEFYEKMLERNRALRRLLGDAGERQYSAYGNELYMLRTPRMPVTERLETLRAYCERHHPRDEVAPPATGPDAEVAPPAT
ncbi:transmembrane protein 177-like [Pollicipes pollicipes]|uniref:transmembrane protein 177-like n=1 Tax=Pollicipes pollicipes TaxID=41117 RepID=UPI0018856BA0|nr:transmembrane protein 177-like [Pollicipes pollicipes]XP_037068999.1 transmembrane protein 177-like [Pollicipes pollicipes]XP_037069000.1 transmembrane protein 177-like [Pollicipes pollicipes]XP_037069001.1 transmembrane protein 177-like [Pollicipes pollicipes]